MTCFLPTFSLAESVLPVPSFGLTSPAQTNSGYIKLTWGLQLSQSALDTLHFELQRSRDAAFESVKTIYEGPDLASFRSGLPNGTFYYRVRTVSSENGLAGPWSEPLNVVVEHQSLTLAFSLAGVGCAVFLAVVVVVLRGISGQRSEMVQR